MAKTTIKRDLNRVAFTASCNAHEVAARRPLLRALLTVAPALGIPEAEALETVEAAWTAGARARVSA